MKYKIFYDTNEILDWILDRPKNSSFAGAAIQRVFTHNVEGYITGHSLTDVFYLIRKKFNKEDSRQFIDTMVSNFTILTGPKETFQAVLSDPDFDDLEDGLQMQCASEAQLDYIVTENLSDFRNSEVTVLSAKQFLSVAGEGN